MVTAGKEKGKTSTIVRVFPKTNMVLLDGINMSKKHRRRTQNSKSGQIVEITMPINASNVMILDPKSGKPTRISIQKTKDGERSRVAVKSKQTIK